jgi:hypothetical protein
MQSKLVTILCTDVVGYSKLMQSDELNTLKKLSENRKIIDPLITKFNGRIFNTAGDSVLAEFSSAVDAVNFSVAMQSQKLSLTWRIGIALGEVYIFETNLLGDTVNIAARVEAMADYGGVCMTNRVYEQVQGRVSSTLVDRGYFNFKNITDPMRIWCVDIPGAVPNPNAMNADAPDHSIKDSKTLVKQVHMDKAAGGKTLEQALHLKRDKKFGPASRVLMWRITRQDGKSLDELLDMASKKLIPVEYRNHAVAILDDCCKKVSSERLMKIAKVLEDGHLGNHRAKSMEFWKLAAQTNPEAAFKYASIILSDTNSSPAEIDEAMGHMEEAARAKNVFAAMILAKYLAEQGQDSEAFKWFWCARSWKDLSAQSRMESLIAGKPHAEVQNWKYQAEALLDQIEFNNQPRIL